MTQIEVTKKMFADLGKGTVLSKAKYDSFSRKYYVRDKKYHTLIEYPSRWELIIQNPEKFGVERIEAFHKVPTSKITTVDVLEMVKKGCSVEEIENAIYTTTKSVSIIIK